MAVTGQPDSTFLIQVNSMYCSFNHSFIPPSIQPCHSFSHLFTQSFLYMFEEDARRYVFASFLACNTQAFDRQPLLRTGRGSGMVSVVVPTMQLPHCPSPCLLLPNRRARSSAVCAETSNAKHYIALSATSQINLIC